MIKYYLADFGPKGGTPPPFTDKNFVPSRTFPENFLQNGLKMALFAPQKTPVFWSKNEFWILGVPPSPLYGQDFFGKKGVTDLGGTPPIIRSQLLR